MITRVLLIIGMFSAALLSPGTSAFALEPGEVLVVANTAVPSGIELASYYMKQRGIPEENILRVSLPEGETISRKQYDDKIAAPVLKTLKTLEPRRRIRCLLLMYGMPLRVAAPEIGLDEKKLIATLEQRREETRRLIDALPATGKEEKERLAKDLAAVDAEIASAKKTDQSASVDSEIALVAAGSYPLAGWVPNPFFLGNQNKELAVGKSQALMVSRLDGPSEKIVRRIIDDSLAAEKQGLIRHRLFRRPLAGARRRAEGRLRVLRCVHPPGRAAGCRERPAAGQARFHRKAFSTRRGPGCRFVLRLVQPGELRGCLHVEERVCRLPHRQQRVRDAEAEGEPGVVQAHAGRGGRGRHRAGG